MAERSLGSSGSGGRVGGTRARVGAAGAVAERAGFLWEKGEEEAREGGSGDGRRW